MVRLLVPWLAFALVGCELERKSVPVASLDHCDVVACVESWDDLAGSAADDHDLRSHGTSSTGGGVSQTEGFSQAPVAIRDTEGRPMVAWHDDTGGVIQVRVKTWAGGEWVELGAAPAGASATAGTSSNPSLAILADGSPAIAWQDDTSGVLQVHVKVWTGSVWLPLGGGTDGVVSTSAGTSRLPQLVSGDGELFLAWADETSGRYQVYLLSWNGSAWVDLGGSATGDGVSQSVSAGYRPSVAVNAAGQPVVAWEDWRADSTVAVFLSVWTGTWDAINSSMDTDGISGVNDVRAPSVIIDPVSDDPVVAWQDLTTGGIHAARVAAKAWESTRVAVGPGGAGYPTVGLDPTGGAMVAWSDFAVTEPEQIYVATWIGGTWQTSAFDVVQLTEDPGRSRFPCLHAPGDAAPLLVWQDDSTSRDITSTDREAPEIFLEELGDTWAALGNDTLVALTESGDGAALVPALAMGSEGPIVAWHVQALDGSSSIHALRYDGTGWRAYGSGSQVSVSDGSTNGYPRLADDTAKPTLVWTHVGATSVVYLVQWDGAQWAELGGSASGDGVSRDGQGQADLPVVQVGASGPVVVWQDRDVADVSQIYLARWSGSSWEGLAGSASGSGLSGSVGGSFTPAVALDPGGEAVVAWTDDSVGPFEIYLLRWHNGAWQELAGSASASGLSGTANNSLFPAVASDADGQPVVAWVEQNALGRFTYVRRWDAGTNRWGELDGSASGTGLGGLTAANASANVDSHAISIAIDSRDRIWVAWTDASTGTYEIYAKRWDGQQWQAVAGSATGGGVSNSSAPSIRPAIAAGEESTCLAWSAGVGQTMEIAVRCAAPGS